MRWLALSAASALLLRNQLFTEAYLDTSTSCATDHQNHLKLKLVQIVFRHGARTPLTDKYWEGATWDTGPDCGQQYEAVRVAVRGLRGEPQPLQHHDAKQAATVLPGGCTKGELTRPGQQQAYGLGAWLRQRYVDQLGFLPPTYTEGVFAGRSTNFRRTIGTLAGVVTGLWPGTMEQVPIQTSQDVEEVLYGRSDSCERLMSIMKARTRALRESDKTDERVASLEAQAREIMGLPEDHRVRFTDLHDALTSMRFHGKPIPQGFTEELLRGIDQEATRRMTSIVAPQASEAHGPELLRLSMGPLFLQIVDRMAARAGGESTALLYAYSGHDTTIMPVLAALGVHLKDWPEYLSNVVFELWEGPAAGDGTSKHYVRVLFNKEDLALAKHPKGEPVLLEEFQRTYLEPYVLTDQQFEQECKIQLDHSAPALAGSVGGSAVQGL